MLCHTLNELSPAEVSGMGFTLFFSVTILDSQLICTEAPCSAQHQTHTHFACGHLSESPFFSPLIFPS